MNPDFLSLVRVKRDDERPLTEAEIHWLFGAYAAGEVADEQMSALLMAIYFNGLDGAELRAWTGEMIASGDRLDLRGLPGPSVDKHSTGGVGDKVSIVLAPLVASCGAIVPMLSGRGLGHTGGTLDKLESIPGFVTNFDNSNKGLGAESGAGTGAGAGSAAGGGSVEGMRAALSAAGCVIAAAGAELAPADRRLYALRDVTGTVESRPLIASSIMSKKIAEGTDALVLDVKTGTGAFMRDQDKAAELARVMVALGHEHGVRTRALLTRMDTPLGRAVGNAVEVEEAIAALQGDGPPDLMDVTYALAGHMLDLAGIDADPREAISSGRAYATFRSMVRAQGGDPDAPLPRAAHREKALPAPQDGYVTRLDARALGVAAWRLGAGRSRKEDAVSHTAGVRCLVKPGDYVRRGQQTVELAADGPGRSEYAKAALEAALTVSDQPAPPASLIVEEIA